MYPATQHDCLMPARQARILQMCPAYGRHTPPKLLLWWNFSAIPRDCVFFVNPYCRTSPALLQSSNSVRPAQFIIISVKQAFGQRKAVSSRDVYGRRCAQATDDVASAVALITCHSSGRPCLLVILARPTLILIMSACGVNLTTVKARAVTVVIDSRCRSRHAGAARHTRVTFKSSP